MSRLLRAREPHGHARVGFIELFFDLVFVFAITQLSHHLLEHFTPRGAFETGLMFVATWWLWVNTAWVTNWLDPERTPVRLMLAVQMLAGLFLSAAIPSGFGAGGLAFALAYVFMQLSRDGFMLWALGDASPGNTRNFQRITLWHAAAGLCWLAGGLAGGGWRFAFWSLAAAIDCAGPAMGFRVPRLGRSTTADWDVEGGHMAERCGLFIIIALGESILVTGATFAKLDWDGPTVAAFVAAFVGSVAMWWIYFDVGAARGSRVIAGSHDPGRLARLAYTYIHMLIAAGIVVTAAADEFVLAHPTGPADGPTIIATLGGALLFLLGVTLFKRAQVGRPPLSHLVGLGLLAAWAVLAPQLAPLPMAAGVVGILILVAVWEMRSLRHARAAGFAE